VTVWFAESGTKSTSFWKTWRSKTRGAEMAALLLGQGAGVESTPRGGRKASTLRIGRSGGAMAGAQYPMVAFI
jgi:hypothetical protein